MKPSLEISDSRLIYRDGEISEIWAVGVKDIVLIAEYTTDEGPQADDYYLVFASVEAGKAWFSTCSFYSDGTDAVFRTLRAQFGMPLEFGLLRSTHWDSRVIWPVHLAGSDYFQFTAVDPVGIWEMIRKALLGPQFEYKPTEAVWSLIHSEVGAPTGLTTPAN